MYEYDIIWLKNMENATLKRTFNTVAIRVATSGMVHSGVASLLKVGVKVILAYPLS